MKNMKQFSFRSFLFVLALSAGLDLTSCKNKAKENPGSTTNTSADSNNANSASPEIASDAALEQGVRDATKDYPDVTATVDSGEVTLKGTIERDKLPALMQSIQGLSPKKVNNQLTLK
jgi:hypothetical protein